MKVQILILMLFLMVATSQTVKSQDNPSLDKLESIAKNAALDSVIMATIEISANDFYKNQQPLPLAFRAVQFKYYIKANKEILYILCGEFTTQDKQNNQEWTHFTTIKNSDYEQWIGPNGLTYCENSKEIPYKKSDLSIELKNKLNAIQKCKK